MYDVVCERVMSGLTASCLGSQAEWARAVTYISRAARRQSRAAFGTVALEAAEYGEWARGRGGEGG